MRVFFAAVSFCFLSVVPASARGYLSGDCGTAARLGGPCGCVAMRHLGLTDRKFWLVSNWRVFPRTVCQAGAAALWGNRHVEAVVGCDGGMAITSGPYGTRRTPAARLTFVNPRGGTRLHFDPIPTRFARVHRAAARHYAHYRGMRTAGRRVRYAGYRPAWGSSWQ